MEKQLPAVRKLELIPIERRNFPKANRKRKKIQRKRKRQCCKRTGHSNSRQHDVKRGDGCDHLHPAGRTDLKGGEQRNGRRGKERCRRRNELYLRSA